MSGFWQNFEQRLASVGVALWAGEILFSLMGLRTGSKEFTLADVQRILVVRLDEIGDVVLLTPFLRELRRNVPTAWITLIVRPSTITLVEFCPYVNEIISFDCSTELRTHRLLKSHWLMLKLAATRLWRRRFDLAISPRRGFEFNHEPRFLAYLSGARWRIGYAEGIDDIAEPTTDIPYFDRLLTHPLRNDPSQHTVQHNLAVLRAIGGRVHDESLELWLSEKDQQFAAKVLEEAKVPHGAPIMGLAPGALHGKRRWPLQYFVDVAKQYIDEFDGCVVVVGGPHEKELGESMRRQLRSNLVNLANRASLRQSTAVLSRCAVFVGNDTGPLHLAAAMKVPVIEISCHPQSGSRAHANSPVRFGPWGVDSVVLQPALPLAPCVDGCAERVPHCITQVRVEDVNAAVLLLMTKRARLLQVAQSGPK